MPAVALAHPKDKYKDKDWITANEMVTPGFVAAGLICVAGYLVLCRHRARSHAHPKAKRVAA